MNKVTKHIIYFLLTFSSLFVSQHIFSQDIFRTTNNKSKQPFRTRDDIDIDNYCMFGINGFNNLAIETGYTVRIKKYTERHGTEREFSTLFQASCDFQVYPNFRITPKISNKYFLQTWYETNYQLLFGADYLLFNNFHTANYVIRPIIGLHICWGVTLAYGYNIKLDNNPFIMPARHNISLTIPFYFPFLFIPE